MLRIGKAEPYQVKNQVGRIVPVPKARWGFA
jgi:hypothetical protein